MKFNKFLPRFKKINISKQRHKIKTNIKISKNTLKDQFKLKSPLQTNFQKEKKRKIIKKKS